MKFRSHFRSEDSKSMEPFFIPVIFSQYDSSQVKLNVEDKENEDRIKLKTMEDDHKTSTKQKSVRHIFGKTKRQLSVFFNFKDGEVPTKPLPHALLSLTKFPNLEEKFRRVKQVGKFKKAMFLILTREKTVI